MDSLSELKRNPDSLKLASQLAALKLVHGTASSLEGSYGDKCPRSSLYMKGIQGAVSRPVVRDYLYLNAHLGVIRSHLANNLARAVLNELFRAAFKIFERHENRRRMGVELMVLTVLADRAFEMPEKYYYHFFVIDMLVSIKHRFQKPNVSYFWSKQSESILISFLPRAATFLTELSLPMVNDAIARAVAVEVRELKEFEAQLSLDFTDEGLLAIAGVSTSAKDQGIYSTWDHSLNFNKDFGLPKDWYIKDSLLFTPPAPFKARKMPPEERDRIPVLYPTGFGCKKLTKLVIRGDFVFPPMAKRANFNKNERGPVIEIGIYAALARLPRLKEFLTGGSTALAVAKFAQVVGPTDQLPLRKMHMVRSKCFKARDLDAIAALCPDLEELVNLGTDSVDDPDAGSTVCGFLGKFSGLKRISCHVPLPCLFSARETSAILTHLTINSTGFVPGDLIALRLYAPNLEKLEGRFWPDHDVGHVHHHRDAQYYETVNRHSDNHGNVRKLPWRRLRFLELNGVIDIGVVRRAASDAEFLQVLNVTSSPHLEYNEGIALDDGWLTEMIKIDGLKNVREVSLRLGSRYAEDGHFSKTGLEAFLEYAVENYPDLKKLTGEFTTIPDRELEEIKRKFVTRGLKGLEIKNVEPYREFRTPDFNDAFYGMNEGYWNHKNGMVIKPRDDRRRRRAWGYVFRPRDENH